MLDHSDQQQLNRNVELRNNAAHRIGSVAIAIVAMMVNPLFAPIVTIVVAGAGGGYITYLAYDYLVSHKAIRRMRRRAAQNEQAFKQGLHGFLETIGNKH